MMAVVDCAPHDAGAGEPVRSADAGLSAPWQVLAFRYAASTACHAVLRQSGPAAAVVPHATICAGRALQRGEARRLLRAVWLRRSGTANAGPAVTNRALSLLLLRTRLAQTAGPVERRALPRRARTCSSGRHARRRATLVAPSRTGHRRSIAPAPDPPLYLAVLTDAGP